MKRVPVCEPGTGTKSFQGKEDTGTMDTKCATYVHEIRRLYRQIHEMTETLAPEDSSEAILSVFEKRSGLFQAIKENMRLLAAIDSAWKKRCAHDPDLHSAIIAIDGLIIAITALDHYFADILHTRMEEIRPVIRRIGNSGRGALLYAQDRVVS